MQLTASVVIPRVQIRGWLAFRLTWTQIAALQLLLSLTLFAGQSNGQVLVPKTPVPNQLPLRTLVDSTEGASKHLQHFENLVSDAWVVTAKTGKRMVHTWKWGPGRYSVERWTEGEGAGGEPWRELMVYYWAAEEKEIHLLGISPFADGIARGVIEFDGVHAMASVKLAQTQATRDMQTQWLFKDSDHYIETLLEKDKTGNYSELVSFEHVRISAPEVYEPENSPSIPPKLQGLSFLLGDRWRSRWPNDPEKTARASIAWIPTANFYFGRVFREPDGHSKDAWAHIYAYRGVESKQLRCLTLTAESAVYEGVIESLREDEVKAELNSNSADDKHPWTASIEKIDVRTLLQNTHISTSESKSTQFRWIRD